jgi:hypothetical protein
VSSQTPNNKGKGFAGLDDMVSDVSEDIGNTSKSETTKASEPASPPTPPTPTPPHTTPTPSSGDSQSTGSGSTGIGKVSWIVAGAIVCFIFIINAAQDGKHAEVPALKTAALVPYEAAPQEAAPAHEAAAPAPVARAPAKPSTWSMDKPPIGRNAVLNVGQIRYCLAEKLRMDAYEGVIDNTREEEINRFNVLVNDYNTRCGEFRYHLGDLERAQLEVDASRGSIIASAQREWIRNSVGIKTTPTQPVRPVAPARMSPQPYMRCGNDIECSGLQLCIRGKCALPVREGEACDRTDECAGKNSQCVNGSCKVDAVI